MKSKVLFNITYLLVHDVKMLYFCFEGIKGMFEFMIIQIAGDVCVDFLEFFIHFLSVDVFSV